MENIMIELEKILENVRSSAVRHNNATSEFKNWVRSEHAKIDDPKFRSYSIIAEMINID